MSFFVSIQTRLVSLLVGFLFLCTAVLGAVLGFSGVFARLMQRVPMALAAGMLAGVLLQILPVERNRPDIRITIGITDKIQPPLPQLWLAN